MKKYGNSSIGTAIVFFCAGIMLHFAHSQSASYWLFASSAIIMILGVFAKIKEHKNKK